MHKRLAIFVIVVSALLHQSAAWATDSGEYPPPPPNQSGQTSGTFTVHQGWGHGSPGSTPPHTGPAATYCTAKDGHYGKVTAAPYTGTDFPYPTPSGPGQWYLTRCGGHDGWVWWRGPNAAPAANMADLLNLLTPLPPEINLSPTGDQVVNMRSFMWVEPKAVTQQATAPDGSTITITATPGDVLWDAGDGTPWFWCPSANSSTPYDAAKSDDAQVTCSHLYDHSSANAPNHAFVLTAHVHWTGTWSGTGGAAGGGALGDIETITSAPVQVSEIQALNRS